LAQYVPFAMSPWSAISWSVEIQFTRDGDNPGLDKFRAHIRCFASWEFERRQDRGVPHS